MRLTEPYSATLKEAVERTRQSYDVLYAGLVGSRCVCRPNSDWDLVVCTKGAPPAPLLLKEGDVSQLILSYEWLRYEKHAQEPVGLVPSVLFKSIAESRAIYGEKPETDEISVQPADFLNCGIKLERYKQRDEKQYLVAILFLRMLQKGRLEDYDFDNIRLAKKLGLRDVAARLDRYYLKRKLNNRNVSSLPRRREGLRSPAS